MIKKLEWQYDADVLDDAEIKNKINEIVDAINEIRITKGNALNHMETVTLQNWKEKYDQYFRTDDGDFCDVANDIRGTTMKEFIEILLSLSPAPEQREG